MTEIEKPAFTIEECAWAIRLLGAGSQLKLIGGNTPFAEYLVAKCSLAIEDGFTIDRTRPKK